MERLVRIREREGGKEGPKCDRQAGRRRSAGGKDGRKGRVMVV